MTGRFPTTTILLFCLACGAAGAAQKTADHPLVGRYEGSKVMHSRVRAFDEYVLPLGKLEDKEFADTLRVEGKITWIGYRNPKGRSTLEVFRNYQETLAENGFEELFVCEGIDDCGYWFGDRVFGNDPEKFLHAADTGPDEGIRYLAAKRAGDGGDAYAQVVVYDDGSNVWTRVRVIEQKARETDKIVVKAEKMARKIDESGRVALYGLYFATDKATIQPESKPTLQEVGRLLQENPDLNLLVVGHTDSQGGFDYNIDLSKRRAAAVTDSLVDDYGIDADRLKPWGVGYTAPVATNATEAGRAKNRRVELVGH